MNIQKLFDLVQVDEQGRVVSIQRRTVAAPFRPRSGEAWDWLRAYWRLITILSLGLLRMNYRADELVLEVRWLRLPLLRFGRPWMLESDGVLCWALALRGGLLGADKGGYFACGARRNGTCWQLTMVLRDFAPSVATLYPQSLWKRLYALTQGMLHHMLGIVYLAQRGRSMALRSATERAEVSDYQLDERAHDRSATNRQAHP